MHEIDKVDHFAQILNDCLANPQKKCYIYGTGLAAGMGYHALQRLGIRIQGFIDREVSEDETFLSKRVFPLEMIECDAKILIYANPEYAIHERLINAGIKDWEYCDPAYSRLYDSTYVESTYAKLKNNQNKIAEVYGLLADELSKTIYEEVIRYRINCSSVYDFCKLYDHNQYFGNDIVPYISGCYVDCGAFTGDTLQRFLRQIDNKEYSYHAFEAEQENSKKIIEFCNENQIKNVQVHCMAAWDHEAKLKLVHDENDTKVRGSVSSCDTTGEDDFIVANSIDNIVDEKIDMIAMDIEGAEMNAIHGAKGHIVSEHPILAISMYHKLDDLWEIPLEIVHLYSKYKIYIRQHRWGLEDTVCYAIPKK